MAKEKKEVNNAILQTSLIGAFGGLFWALIYFFAYALNFVEIKPTIFLLIIFNQASWLTGWKGYMAALFFAILISFLLAFIYYASLRKFKGIVSGACFGLLIPIIIFLLTNPHLSIVSRFKKIPTNTVYSIFCFFILYGIFIGYSISYQEEELERNPKGEGN